MEAVSELFLQSRCSGNTEEINSSKACNYKVWSGLPSLDLAFLAGIGADILFFLIPFLVYTYGSADALSTHRPVAVGINLLVITHRNRAKS
jgi:hypothetical protein